MPAYRLVRLSKRGRRLRSGKTVFAADATEAAQQKPDGWSGVIAERKPGFGLATHGIGMSPTGNRQKIPIDLTGE